MADDKSKRDYRDRTRNQISMRTYEKGGIEEAARCYKLALAGAIRVQGTSVKKVEKYLMEKTDSRDAVGQLFRDVSNSTAALQH